MWSIRAVPMTKAIKLIIQGRVQGGGYRRWFQQQALALQLNGYVRNLATGEVEAVIVGLQAALQEMVERSYEGPKHAQVLNIMQSVSSIEQPFIRFEILRS